MSVGQRARWLSRGFHTYSAGIYGLQESNWHDYLSDFGRYQLIRLNGRSAEVLTDKLLFERAFSKYLDIPRLLAISRSGVACSLAPDFGIGRAMSLHDMFELCPDGLAVKPNSGGGGFGVHIITRELGSIRIDGRHASVAEVEKLLTRTESTLVVARVVQHALSERFFPDTTNSIRISTFIDPDTQKAFVAGAVWRIGVKQSIPVDNWMSGGVCAGIHLETGELSEVARFTPDGPPFVSRMACHPETDVVIAGEIVPNWSHVVARIKHAAELFPMYPVLGWDIVLTAGGFEVLEVNSAPGVNILQIHEPLLRREDVRRFLRHHNILLSPLGLRV